MKKIVIVINGKSGVGKDTLIDAAERHFKIRNVSSIQRVKEIAQYAGWDGVKDDRGRQLLIDIKTALIKYDDLPTQFMVHEYNEFQTTDQDIMFVHIREPIEIQKLSNKLHALGALCKTLLITRKSAQTFNTSHEDEIEQHDYDYTFENNKDIKQSGEEFIKWLSEQIG